MQGSRNSLTLSCVTAGIVLFACQAAAEPPELVRECFDCHGEKGVSTHEDVPIIAGLSEFYLDEQMRAYRDKVRPCIEADYPDQPEREPTDMCELAKDLNNEQIAEIAAYFAQQKFVAAEQSYDQELANKGAKLHDRHCEKCHSEGGSLAFDDAGILSGQWMPYLRHTLDDFLAGDRPMVEKMKPKMEKVDKDDIEALLHYYASPLNE